MAALTPNEVTLQVARTFEKLGIGRPCDLKRLSLMSQSQRSALSTALAELIRSS